LQFNQSDLIESSEDVESVKGTIEDSSATWCRWGAECGMRPPRWIF